MKCFKTFLVPFILFIITVVPGCKKEVPESKMSATTLNAGRATIKFTASKNINGSKVFDVGNTTATTATNQAAGAGSTLRNIRLDATEMDGNVATRNANIYIAVREQIPTSIDLARTSLPMGKIEISSYALFGTIRRSQSGTITITNLNASLIEGSFTATLDDGTIINDGRFAGKF